MNAFDSYKDIGTPISKEEAAKILAERNGIITGGGYTFLPGHYCAQGTLPGCLRGGDTTTLGRINVEQWFKISLRELIIKVGFYPDAFMTGFLAALQQDLKDRSIDLDDMIKFCIDGPFTVEQLKKEGRFGNSKIWMEYFENKI